MAHGEKSLKERFCTLKIRFELHEEIRNHSLGFYIASFIHEFDKSVSSAIESKIGIIRLLVTIDKR